MPLIVGSEGLESKIFVEISTSIISSILIILYKKWDAGINFFKNKGIDGL